MIRKKATDNEKRTMRQKIESSRTLPLDLPRHGILRMQPSIIDVKASYLRIADQPHDVVLPETTFGAGAGMIPEKKESTSPLTTPSAGLRDSR
jgi:hypothetical protein